MDTCIMLIVSDSYSFLHWKQLEFETSRLSQRMTPSNLVAKLLFWTTWNISSWWHDPHSQLRKSARPAGAMAFPLILPGRHSNMNSSPTKLGVLISHYGKGIWTHCSSLQTITVSILNCEFLSLFVTHHCWPLCTGKHCHYPLIITIRDHQITNIMFIYCYHCYWPDLTSSMRFLLTIAVSHP